MINFYYEGTLALSNEEELSSWIRKVILSESKSEGELSFIFCDDTYLLKINQDFLKHDTYTDIISFDTSMGNQIGGDVFISIERVAENANDFEVLFEEELRRVIIHGVLHFCGYKDKSDRDQNLMTQKENEKLAMFHVEH